jgi:hypothetical protein
MLTSATLILFLAAAAAPQPSAPAAATTTAAPIPAPVATTYRYKGRQVSSAWIDQQYAYFHDKIACVDGKFCDMGRWLLLSDPAGNFSKDRRPPCITAVPPSVGDVRIGSVIREDLGSSAGHAGSGWAGLSRQALPEDGDRAKAREAAAGPKVLQLVGKNAALIVCGDLIFHVVGIDPAKEIDGAPFRARLVIYLGTYQYTNAIGTTRTVQSFAANLSVTWDQFAEALAGGFQLVRYKVVTKKASETQGGKRVVVDKTEIVGEPVP